MPVAELDGIEIAYELVGEGEPWVLTPGGRFTKEVGGLPEMARALADEGRQIVMTTHDLGQARRIAGRVLFLHRGRLVEDAPAAMFFDAPSSAQARAIIRYCTAASSCTST